MYAIRMWLGDSLTPRASPIIGGRHKNDKGLYVSTGGFSKDAHYEADRANIPITLMDMDELAHAVSEHYEKMDAETRALVPLIKIFWPA